MNSEQKDVKEGKYVVRLPEASHEATSVWDDVTADCSWISCQTVLPTVHEFPAASDPSAVPVFDFITLLHYYNHRILQQCQL